MLVGILKREPPIRLEEWLALASTVPELSVPGPKTYKNPFTGELVTRLAPVGTFNVAGDGFRGAVALSGNFESDGVLEVYAPEERPAARFIELIDGLGARMSARSTWFDPIRI